jgi:hypothetical protein
MNNNNIMEIDDTVIKAAEEYMRTRGHKQEQPMKKSADEMRREAICERWKEAVENRCLEHEVPVPENGLMMPLESAVKDDAITITYIGLRMKLVYDSIGGRYWQGDYACPKNAPDIEIDILCKGEWKSKKERVLDFVVNAISEHIGKAVQLDGDNWTELEAETDEGEHFISLGYLDNNASWNIADFLLAKDGY